MGYSKGASQPLQPPVYRDEPQESNHAETASMASAVLLDDIDYPDEELPSYTDLPTESSISSAPSTSHEQGVASRSLTPAALPFSTRDTFCNEVRTRFPNYSTDSALLYSMIREQAACPPTYFVQIFGTHTETRRNGNKETKDRITDFKIQINITNLLAGARGTAYEEQLQLIPDNKRGYRGTIIPKLMPNFAGSGDEEANPGGPLRLWCDKYVADPSKVKSFTLKREISNHDTKKLEQLLRSAISETNYRGHVSVSFPTQYTKVIVYSPSTLNEWRITTWIRWFFYLTFLWVFAWPVLFFMTSRYEVVKVVYSYADVAPGVDDVHRRCTVMSEVEWFNRWQSAIKRAALARMVCKDSSLDEEYRRATEEADRRGEVQGRVPDIPVTGNVFADGALGLVAGGLRVVESYNGLRGWGADC